LLIAVTISQLMYLTLPTFGPIYVGKKHSDITPFLFSIITSMYQVSRLFLSTTIGTTLAKVGKKNYIMIGFSLMITACIGFALLGLIPDSSSDMYFFWGGLICNFVQGVGGTCLMISGQAIVLI